MKKELRENWKCDGCKSNHTPIRQSSSSSEDSEEEEDHKDSNESFTEGKTDRAILQINKTLSTMVPLVKDMRDLKESVTYMSNQFDNFLEEITSLKSSMASLAKENSELKTAVGELQRKVDLLEQNSRSTAIEVHGVPETHNEECTQIISAVTQALKVNCGAVKRAFRVGPVRKDRPRKILAELESSEVRETLVAAARMDKSLSAIDIHKNWPKERIYINENLTSFRAELLRRAKSKGKEKGFRYVWVKNFTIYMRKAEGERAIAIRSIEDINSL
ncbi:unnamed protein product [Nesidiocoris tenuis]|nr:unnamed protein product [Nesidiocoris tenuis]CAB0015934.1 unnamed protein product [Nesidiocoris tenuis]